MDEINTLINKLLEEKTFSLEAITVINELKVKSDVLQNDLNILKSKYDIAKKEHYDCRDSLIIEQSDNNLLREQIADYKKLTEKYQESVIRAEFAEKAKQDLFELTKIVFRNEKVRTSVNGYKAGNGSNSFNYTAEQLTED